MTMRLNGWQRIGLVASVIWAVGAPIYMDQAAQREASDRFSESYERCRDIPTNDPERCFKQASDWSHTVPRYTLRGDPQNVAIVSLVPIVFGWLLAYALVYLVRWIRAGFKPSA
jgi:hypothetical protein